MWRCTGLNESVWSPGTPQGPPWGFWGHRAPKKKGLGILGVGGRGGPPRLALLLALSWANRLILTYMAT